MPRSPKVVIFVPQMTDVQTDHFTLRACVRGKNAYLFKFLDYAPKDKLSYYVALNIAHCILLHLVH